MTIPQEIVGRLRLLRPLVRFATCALVWLLVAGVGTACSFPPGASCSPGASEDWAAFHNALVFGSSTAIAVDIATAVAFAVEGKTKWAFESSP
jgi:hypothetical protein